VRSQLDGREIASLNGHMADESLLEKVHNLSDLELAALLCLISREHCLISTSEDAVDELVEELQLVRRTFFSLPLSPPTRLTSSGGDDRSRPKPLG